MKALVLICLLLTSSAFSQKTITAGKTQTLDGEHQLNELLGELKGRLIASAMDQENHVAKLISVDLKGNELLMFDLEKVFPEDIFFYVSCCQVIVLTAVVEDDQKILRLQILNEQLKLQSTKDILSHRIESDIHPGNFKIGRSMYQGQIAVLHEIPNKLGGTEELVVHMLDHDFGIQWTASYRTKIKQTNNPTNRIVVGDNGTVHVVKRHREGSSFKYFVYQFMEDKPAIQHTLDLRGPRITELNMACDYNGNLLVSGFYTTATYDESSGYFHRIYGGDGAVKTKIQRAFKPEFMEKFIGKKAHKKGASLSHVEISAVLSHDDNFLVVYENQMRETSKPKGSDKLNENFIDGPIHVVQIDAKGDFVNDIDISEKQNTWNKEHFFASFRAFDYKPDVITKSSFMVNEISSSSKTRTAVTPFNKSAIVDINKKGDVSVITLNIPSTNTETALISPKLADRSSKNWYMILTNKSRTSITPAFVKHDL